MQESRAFLNKLDACIPLRGRKEELNSKFGTDSSNYHNYGHVAAARKLKANSFVPKPENNGKQ